MDTVISARIDSSVAETLDREARRLGITKKRYLEDAINLKAAQTKSARAQREREIDDALAASFGSMVRDETAGETVRQMKERWQLMWKARRERFDESH